MDHLKNSWKSMTIWFNAMVGGILSMGDTIKDNLPFAQQYLTPDLIKYAVIAVIAINIALRFKTNKSLADK